MALTNKQIKQLRTLANSRKPLVHIGKQDLNESVIAQIDQVLEDHELVKCTLLDGSGLDAKQAAQILSQALHADVVQTIGNRLILFRISRKKTIKHITLINQ